MRLSWWFQSACEAPAPKETVATDSAEFAPAAAAKKMCLIADFSGKAGGSTPSTVGLSVSLTAAGQAIVKESDEYPVCPAARHSSRPDARIFNLCQRAIFSLISGGRRVFQSLDAMGRSELEQSGLDRAGRGRGAGYQLVGMTLIFL